ncbi:MAG: DeoR/GlpR family DNA-binding transcription regulator [Anaerolineae bacterium]
MYPAERRQKILEWIHQDSRVSVAELAEHFGVSRSSIRRDLNHLSRAGLLKRTYGGAVQMDAENDERPFSVREVSHREEKTRIGRFAASLLRPGETVFVDGGTTTECMLPFLPDHMRLTIVTYGLNIAARLAGRESLTVIVIGGTLHHRSLTISGVLAMESFHSYRMHFDRAFLACSGVSAEGGVTNASFEEIPMKRKAIESAREVILLADSSKVGVVAAGLIAPITKIDRIITDRAAPEAEVGALRRLGVEVNLA